MPISFFTYFYQNKNFMKKLFTLLFSFCAFNAFAQSTIYLQTFNTGSASDWSMNTSDLGGTVGLTGNQWVINNSYAAGPLGTVTPAEPTGTGITAPNSYYLHMNCGPTYASLFGSNDNFQAIG